MPAQADALGAAGVVLTPLSHLFIFVCANTGASTFNFRRAKSMVIMFPCTFKSVVPYVSVLPCRLYPPGTRLSVELHPCQSDLTHGMTTAQLLLLLRQCA